MTRAQMHRWRASILTDAAVPASGGPARAPRLRVVNQACFQATEKAPLLMLDGCALTVEPACIVMASIPGVVLVSAVPLTCAPLKLAVPKLARGSGPPLLDGASAITSADANFALLRRLATDSVHPRVVFVSASVKLPLPSVVTVAVK